MIITKPKIFISSTIVDLPSERKAALRAVEKVGGIPLMSEFTMEAVDSNSLNACLDKVGISDIYVLIIGGKYGWKPFGIESITELEYNKAVEMGLAILVFNTTYQKDPDQSQFEKRVENHSFRKTVSDAFDLELQLISSLTIEIQKKQNEYFNKTEFVFSNLTKIYFPQYLYRAELKINKKEIKSQLKEKGEKLKFKPSLFDYAINALSLKEIRFPGDWIVWGNGLYTFHDLHDHNLPLTEIIDLGTAERINCNDFCSISQESQSSFKFLLKRCLSTKLHKHGIKWYSDEKLFVFIPNQKDRLERWKAREISWSKKKKATRTVVDPKYNLKNNKEVFNLKCLSFKSNFYLLDNQWYLSIKPDWIFLWPSLKVCDFAFKNIQWLKKNERNIHIFNHFNFILRYIQSSSSKSLFIESSEYEYLKVGKMEKFPFAPIVPDDIWKNLESPSSRKKLYDKVGNIQLFE
jgi:hypothetical protein